MAWQCGWSLARPNLHRRTRPVGTGNHYQVPATQMKLSLAMRDWSLIVVTANLNILTSEYLQFPVSGLWLTFNKNESGKSADSLSLFIIRSWKSNSLKVSTRGGYSSHQRCCWTPYYCWELMRTCMGWASLLLVSRVLRSQRARLQTSKKVTICLPGLAAATVLVQANLRRVYLIFWRGLGLVTDRRRPE